MTSSIYPRSWSGLAGGLCGALAVALGLVVLGGWAFHSLFLIQIAPNLAPMQRNTAMSFALSGLALLGGVINRPRRTFVFSVEMPGPQSVLPLSRIARSRRAKLCLRCPQFRS